MAQAKTDPTRIDDLDDLLRYLTEDLGYEKYAALWEMERQYLDGVLLLTKREYRSDDTPYGDAIAIDTEYGHLELDRRGRVRVVPRSGFEWREVRYGIAERCDVRAIWPRPPASKTAPDQQQEDKTGLDPFKTGAAGRPTAAHLIKPEAERRIAEKEVTPNPGGLAAFSRVLAEWWAVERLTFNPHGPEMKAGTIKNVVRELWNAALGVQNSQNS